MSITLIRRTSSSVRLSKMSIRSFLYTSVRFLCANADATVDRSTVLATYEAVLRLLSSLVNTDKAEGVSLVFLPIVLVSSSSLNLCGKAFFGVIGARVAEVNLASNWFVVLSNLLTTVDPLTMVEPARLCFGLTDGTPREES